jgi:hypothetical protein
MKEQATRENEPRPRTIGAGNWALYSLALQAACAGLTLLIANVARFAGAISVLQLLTFAVPLLGLVAAIAGVVAAIGLARPRWFLVPVAAGIVVVAQASLVFVCCASAAG